MYIVILIIIIIIFLVMYNINNNKIYDFASIMSATPKLIIIPESYNELQNILIKNYNSKTPLKISLRGACYSHGGQTMNNDNICISLDKFKDINLTPDITVTVSAGVIWHDLITYLDDYNLSVAEMQSYCNFNICASISVNAHGRGIKYGTVGDSVTKLKCMLSNGDIITVFPNEDIFKAIVGGYGGIAIILEATLKIDCNYKIKRIVEISNDFKFDQNNKNLIFYNTYVYPTNEKKYVNIYWVKTDDKLTITDRVKPINNFYFSNIFFEQLVRRLTSMKYLRSLIEPDMLQEEEIVMRNYEMSLDVNELYMPLKYPTTAILQEYFIPIKKAHDFIPKFWKIIKDNGVNLLNLSIRFVKKTSTSILNYAKDDMFAFVLYLNVGNNSWSYDCLKEWTQQMIDVAINLSGTYYLPYLPLATKEQFRLSYPNYKEYLIIKKKYDNKNILSNLFIEEYLN